MKQKIKFKALTYHGKVIFFTKEFDCPDFEVIPSTNLKGIDLPETTVESQIPVCDGTGTTLAEGCTSGLYQTTCKACNGKMVIAMHIVDYSGS